MTAEKENFVRDVKDKKIDELQGIVNAQIESIAVFRKRVDECEAEMKVFEEQKTELQLQVETAITVAGKAGEELKQLQNEKATLQNTILELQAQLDKRGKELFKFDESLFKAHSQIKTLKEQIESLNKKKG